MYGMPGTMAKHGNRTVGEADAKPQSELRV